MDVPINGGKFLRPRIEFDQLPQPHKDTLAALIDMAQIDLKKVAGLVEFGKDFGSAHVECDGSTKGEQGVDVVERHLTEFDKTYSFNLQRVAPYSNENPAAIASAITCSPVKIGLS